MPKDSRWTHTEKKLKEPGLQISLFGDFVPLAYTVYSYSFWGLGILMILIEE